MTKPLNYDAERAALIARQMFDERFAQLRSSFPDASGAVLRARALADTTRALTIFDDAPDHGRGEF